ncbi:hypothetical protein ET989_12260 [Propioniciclava sinopodophylli]|uniref:Uncharacterized protein n=1 Tax=Propioniciclava sinopodophylli TaxID=1837344 RepID=A0A4Q9KCI5_9ACTN|nr:hypothetical protein [Propioniciclava sinopodophylli]TBT83239.1 hypothetical protein ET989_12260 [Propioniciclava sinopodophylli]
MINAAMHSTGDTKWFSLLGPGIEDDWQQVVTAGAEYRRTVEGIETLLTKLVPRGWAVMTMQTEALERAMTLVEEGRGGEADDLLADQWAGEGAWRTKRVCDRVRVMGVPDPELRPLFEHRARLLRLAKVHHEAGRYDASIPLLQAQLEGIVIDVTSGKKFFTKSKAKADLVDPKRLVSIEAGLAALQATYGEDVKQTQAGGSLSRHGVAHGRELAYDTRVNSAKTWSVMDALVEWALPKARELVDQRKADRQAANAGSQAVDDNGKRVDDREFFETRDMLRLLSNSAMGHHRQRGHFRDDLVGGVYGDKDFTKRGLPAVHGVQQAVRADGAEVIYWRETISGRVLGIALRWEGGAFVERYWAASVPPDGFTSDGWSLPWESPPDWA